MKRLIIGTAVLLLSSFTLMLSSQTINEAGEVFNEGVKLKDTDVNAAIIKFNDCINICEKLGDEGIGLKINAENALPPLYYKVAMELYKEKKYIEAVKAFEEASVIAGKYSNAKLKNKADNIIPKLYAVVGNNYLKEKDFDNAMLNYNKAIELDSNSLKGHFGKAVIYKKNGDNENTKAELDKIIKIGPADNKVVVKATNTAIKHFQVLGGKSIQQKKYDEGIEYLDTSLTYGETAKTYYYISVANNAKQNWKEATEAANKALELDTDGKMKTQINVEIENAKKGMEAK